MVSSVATSDWSAARRHPKDGMLLAASSAALKAKLSEKARWPPPKMVRRKMPDGHEQLAELPNLRAGAPPGDPDAAPWRSTQLGIPTDR